jgi:D-amino peptidase
MKYTLGFLILSATLAQQPSPKKVYISVDLEGISGVSSETMVSAAGSEYDRGRKLMADDTNAAVRGAKAGGATEIVINDSHGSHANLRIEDLAPGVRLITNAFKRYGMMEGLDSTFDAVLFIGYHAKAGSTRGFFAHTGDSNVRDLEIDGRSVGESGMNAIVAAWYGVPVVLITGDDVAVEQYKEQAPSVKSVIVKRAINTRAGELRGLDEVHQEIEQAAREAVSAAQKVPPQRPATTRVKIRFRDILTPEVAEMLPGMERPEPDTIAYTSDSVPRAYSLIRLLYRWINPPPPRPGYDY